MEKALIISDADNTATSLSDLEQGQEISIRAGNRMITVQLAEPIAFGHKFALKFIPEGGHVIKYGEVIGRATADIAPGTHVHSHNLEGIRGRGDRL